MADNYLERKEEEVRQGLGVRSVPHKPSLENLQQRIKSFGTDFDPSYKVHPLQLEAIIRARGTDSNLFGFKPFVAETGEAYIEVVSNAPGNDEFFLKLGMSVQNLMLKAAELDLACSLSFLEDGLPLIRVGRPL